MLEGRQDDGGLCEARGGGGGRFQVVEDGLRFAAWDIRREGTLGQKCSTLLCSTARAQVLHDGHATTLQTLVASPYSSGRHCL